MKISMAWLADYLTLNKGVDVDAVVSGLIQLGHEVDGVEDTAAAWTNVVVGKVVERKQHPDADRLSVCKVDVGKAHGGVRQIVCGAPNVREGLTVAVALPGAVLGEDFKIGTSKIRGVESNGMICSQRELGLGDDHEGIWEMDTKAAIGTPLSEATGRDDVVLDVAVTPNRGDALSHLGLARDLAALGLGALKASKIPTVGKSKCAFKVASKTADCPEINAIEISGTRNGESPDWVRARLEAVGLRPKNILVDVTNYVMLALGQPLHAYDAAKIKGGIYADIAKGGEAFTGLGDVEVKLAAGDVVICDDNGVVGLGGILGGAGSAVNEATTHVLLEAANFERTRIARTGQAHQLITDARYRFERGVDPVLAQQALCLCAALIVEWGGGSASAMVSGGKGVKAPAPIAYDPALCARFGGLEVSDKRQKEILAALGFKVTGNGKAWNVTPPTFRTFMETPEDVVEEILRVEGYENIPAVLPATMPAQLEIDGAPVALDRKARKALAANGFLEAMTYSFIGRADAELLASAAELVEIDNPLAETSMTTMRPSLLPGILRAVAGNAAHKDMTARMGEVGKVFGVQGERLMAAGAIAADGARSWRTAATKPDVFMAKAAALLVLETLGAPVESMVVEAGAGEAYHPGKSGTLRVGPMVLARFGELHPKLMKHFDLSMPLAAFEIELTPLLKMKDRPKAWQPSPYPPVKRDLAFVLPNEVTAAAVQATLREVERKLIQNVDVFDMYSGEHVPEGKKSLALGLTLQAADRTLTEAEITVVVEAAVAAVCTAHNAELRA